MSLGFRTAAGGGFVAGVMGVLCCQTATDVTFVAPVERATGTALPAARQSPGLAPDAATLAGPVTEGDGGTANDWEDQAGWAPSEGQVEGIESDAGDAVPLYPSSAWDAGGGGSDAAPSTPPPEDPCLSAPEVTCQHLGSNPGLRELPTLQASLMIQLGLQGSCGLSSLVPRSALSSALWANTVQHHILTLFACPEAEAHGDGSPLTLVDVVAFDPAAQKPPKDQLNALIEIYVSVLSEQLPLDECEARRLRKRLQEELRAYDPGASMQSIDPCSP